MDISKRIVFLSYFVVFLLVIKMEEMKKYVKGPWILIPSRKEFLFEEYFDPMNAFGFYEISCRIRV